MGQMIYQPFHFMKKNEFNCGTMGKIPKEKIR